MNKGEYIEYFYNQLKEYQIIGMCVCVCLQKKWFQNEVQGFLLGLYIHLLPSM